MKVLKIILRYKVFIVLILVLFFSLMRIKYNKINIVSENIEREIIIEIKNIKFKNNKYIVEFNNFISYYKNDFPYDVGDIVKIKGKIKNIKNKTIPNLFNYKGYLQSKNIQYEIAISEIKLIKKNNNLLKKIRKRIEDRILLSEKKEYLYAFILGDTSYFEDEVIGNYQFNGISYLLSLGSLQVMMIIKLFEWLFKRLKIKKKYIPFLSSIFLALYMLFTNYTIGILRSSLCYILKAVLNCFKIKIKYTHLIIIILCFLLIINPFYLYRTGFYYSFIISIGLSIFKKKKKHNHLKRMLYFPILAFLFSLPINIYVNNEINFLTIILSIIAFPLYSFVVFPLSVVVIFIPKLMFFFNWIIDILEYLNDLFSNITIVNFIFRKPSIIVLLIYYIVIFLILKKPKYFYWILVIMLIHGNINKIISEEFLMILDVSQGDAILLKNNNNVYMIDTGGSNNYEYSDEIIKLLKSYGISKINKLFLTHGDMDHLGSSYSLVRKIKVENVYFNNNEYNDNEKKLINILRKLNINYTKIDKYRFRINNLDIYIRSFDLKSENDSSMIFTIKWNKLRMMLMGDATIASENVLMQEEKLLPCNILKLGHHGSKGSTSLNFWNKVKPKISIISVGKNNIYHLPSEIVLDRIKTSKTYLTSHDGSILINFQKSVTISTFSP